MSFLRWLGVAVVVSLTGCGDAGRDGAGGPDAGGGADAVLDAGRDGLGADADEAAACTAEGQEVAGSTLEMASYQVLGLSGDECPTELFVSAGHLAEAFPTSDIPLEVLETDFSRDRVLLHTENPVVRFAVDDGEALVIGEELLCQGAYPSCMVYVIHGSTRGTLEVRSCPYRGPDPCLAP